MTKTCWAPGCRTGYSGASTGKRHLFAVPKDAERRQHWNKCIPRDAVLECHHVLCDLHFDEQYIIKTFDLMVNGELVKIPRERWTLTNDALPTTFPNLPAYLSKNVPKKRVTVHRNSKVSTVQKLDCVETVTLNCGADTISTNVIEILPSGIGESNNLVCFELAKCNKRSCVRCNKLAVRVYQQNKKLRLKDGMLRHLRNKVKLLQGENLQLKNKCNAVDNLPAKTALIVSEVVKSTSCKSSKGNRFSKDWLIDSLLIKCKSPTAYKMLRQQGYLPLPSVATLNRSIQNLRPEFGFDRTLCNALGEKLKAFSAAERRGMLMFDEMQISKHLDFRSNSGKTIGFANFGDVKLDGQCSATKEGDHALVFLFRPHLNSWIQTIGCFCSAGTTPSEVLTKLILEAIVLLENSGAMVDGLVCDGASTNRKAFKQLGWCGTIGSVSNKMVNPCDESRNIYFFNDVPHLLKTVRNNLLHAKVFAVSNIVNLSYSF